jgi:hypothetical protein
MGCVVVCTGHQIGYFKDKSNQKKYAADQCFTLTSKQREMDLYCCNKEDMARWINVLSPLVVNVIDAPQSSTHNATKK